MGSKLYKPVTFCLIFFVCFLLFCSHASAKQCTCQDEIADLQFHLESNEMYYKIWLRELENYKFDRSGIVNNDEVGAMVTRVNDAFQGAVIHRQHPSEADIPPEDLEKIYPLGNRKLFPDYVNPLCWDYYCDISCQLVQKHEQRHAVFDKKISPLTFLSFIIDKKGQAEYVAESEVDAYAYQIGLQKTELEKKKKTCLTDYECSYTEEIFDNAVDCVNHCPQSLLHFGKLCLQIDKKTGKYTGYAV
jgi:hypothetical protein